MGLIDKLLGGAEATAALGDAAQGVSEVFTANATRRMELGYEAYAAALSEHADEFQYSRDGWFDTFVNGLNRLPRPMLALGTLGLFVYAMVSPAGFSQRMIGLGHVPEPLWWLLGAIVSFYFGAREAHYMRTGGGGILKARRKRPVPQPGQENPALDDWLAAQPG